MLKVAELVERAKTQLSEVTGLESVGMVAAHKVGDVWSVSVEMVEVRRVPDTQDVLGIYDAALDEDGNLMSWDRHDLRVRADTDMRHDDMEE